MDEGRPPPLTDAIADLSEADRAKLVRRRATCPFLGPAIAAGDLPVRNDAARPLASLEDLGRLGNSGGGDLGKVLEVFAKGNHAFAEGSAGLLDRPAPAGLFSLDLPGSQGSHPGHSGILQGDPGRLGSGRFDDAAFARLVAPAEDGLLKRSDVGRFIAANLRRDPAARVFGLKVIGLLAVDLAQFVGGVGPALLEKISAAREPSRATRGLYTKLTKLLGEDHLVGSAGEYGLLFAFLAHRPGAQVVDGEPALAVDDLTLMFRDAKFPEGWERWPKRSTDWVANTTALMISAGHAYLAGGNPPRA